MDRNEVSQNELSAFPKATMFRRCQIELSRICVRLLANDAFYLLIYTCYCILCKCISYPCLGFAGETVLI